MRRSRFVPLLTAAILGVGTAACQNNADDSVDDEPMEEEMDDMDMDDDMGEGEDG